MSSFFTAILAQRQTWGYMLLADEHCRGLAPSIPCIVASDWGQIRITDVVNNHGQRRLMRRMKDEGSLLTASLHRMPRLPSPPPATTVPE